MYEGLKIPEATIIQNDLRSKLDTRERNLQLTTIGGADISLNLYSTTIYAGIILLSFPSLQPIAYSLVKAETRFPYVPGYLAFREVPALVKVWEQMEIKP
ncbi:MAG TPA: endonuclease V, partial [Bacteroidia bacterium]